MTRWFSSLLRRAGYGLCSVTCAVARLLNILQIAMPVKTLLPAIALSDFNRKHGHKITKGAAASALSSALLRTQLATIAIVLSGYSIAVNATTITNTVTVTYNTGSGSDSVDVIASSRTPSSVALYQYAPGSPSATNFSIPTTEYSSSGTMAGPFNSSPNPTDISGSSLATPGSYKLAAATALKSGEPLFVRVVDPDQNTNVSSADTLMVTLATNLSGDSVILRLTETGPNTGVFIGYLQTNTGVVTVNDPYLTVNVNDRINISYTDAADSSDSSSTNVMVDPYGEVFSTANGSLLDGATITLIDTATNSPAVVYGDDGVSIFPATITSGGSASDSGGNNYIFPPGNYRFPYTKPGTYQLYVIPPVGYKHPSTVSTAAIQSLSGAPYSIVPGSRGEIFTVNPGPALHIDIPLDSSSKLLFVTKHASKTNVAIGEYLEYKLTLENTSATGLTNVTLTDKLPSGFRFKRGAVLINNAKAKDPAISKDGRTLTFNIGNLAATTSINISYVAAVSIGAHPGTAVNVASATADGGISSNTAKASVLVEDDLMKSRSFITGRVILGGCDVEKADKGNVTLQLQSEAIADEVNYNATIHVNDLPVNDLNLIVNLPEALVYNPGSIRSSNITIREPTVSGNQLTFKLGIAKPNTTYQLRFATSARGDVYGEFTTTANLKFKLNLSSDTTLNKEIIVYSPLVDNKIKDVPRSYRVRFDTLSAEISDADKSNLTEMAYLLRNQIIKQVSVIGYADKRRIVASNNNGFKDNNELSLARANAVASFIKQKFGLQDSQIITNGQGATHPIYYSEKLQNNKFDRQQQLSINRRVEIFIELVDQLADTRFIVSKSDSGIVQIDTQGPDGRILGTSTRLDFAGVKGIRLFLEDGRFVDTDENGLYHFEGLRPGTHIIQIDQDSIPDQYEVYQCENNTRFAGTPYSRFVDLQGGSLWRADFYLRKKPASANRGKVSIRLQSQLQDNRISYHVELSGKSISFKGRTLWIELPTGLNYVNNSARLNGNSIDNPRVDSGKLSFKLDDTSAEAWHAAVSFEVTSTLRRDGEYTTTALLRFHTTDSTLQSSTQVSNSLLLQREAQDRHIFEANYLPNIVDMNKADRADLDSVIDYLMNKRVRKVKVIGYTDSTPIPNNVARHYPDHQALSLARATKVAAYLARKLNLYSKQIEIIGKGNDITLASNNTPSGTFANNRADVFVTFTDANARQIISVSNSDSGIMDTPVSSQYNDTNNSSLMNNKNSDKDTDSSLGILSIKEGDTVSSAIQLIKVRVDARLIPALYLDGERVPDGRIGFTAASKDNKLKVFSYIGINMGRQGEHVLTINGIDPFGNVRYTQDVHYTMTGEVANMRVINNDGNIADGKSPVKVRVELLDKDGKPVHSELELEIRGGNLKPPHKSTSLPELRNGNTVTVDKDGYIYFAPVATSGTYTARVTYGDIALDINTFAKPKFRDWIMVGLAEGTVGYNNITGNMENLDSSDIKDKYYNNGRLAFYAKGKVKGKYLLTTAYDSNREKPQVSGNGLLGSIQPDKYYTLYGDNTHVEYGAASTEKLYVKLESDQFYALYGDYETGLTATELSKYSRTITGLKTEYNSKDLKLSAFATDTKQAFIKDEIQGDGTSGLYHLSHKNIVLNSDKVTIETRDRLKSENILDSRQLTRYTDYTLDPVSGTIYFREPIYSRDSEFNPVYIVVDYEIEGDVDNHVTAGGRISYKPSAASPDIGATVIQEGTTGAEGQLYGADINYDLSKNTKIKLEAATTSKTSGSQKLKGDALLAEISHQQGVINSKVYYREQKPEFGLGQQNGTESGTRKYGADVHSKMNNDVSLNAEYNHQNNLNTEASRDVLRSDIEIKKDIYSTKGGILIARDEHANGDTRQSDLLTGSAQRKFMDGRLTGNVGAQVGVKSDNSDYPEQYRLGAEYALTQNTRLFTQQEFTFGKINNTQTTRAGLKSSPWNNASLSTSVENQNSEYGPRTFANMGLTQGYVLNQFWRVDFGVERSYTLRKNNGANFNTSVPPSSGSVSGEDFTALSAGATYKNTHWSMTSRIETRDGDLEDKVALLAGLYFEPRPGSGLSARLQFFDTDRSNGTSSQQSQLEFSLAHRPFASHWIVLDRIRFLHKEDNSTEDMTTSKYINNLNANYLFNRRNQLAFNHGIKYTKDNFETGSYTGTTQIIGIEYRHDINQNWDTGIQASELVTSVGNNRQYSYGASIGYSFVRNVWISLGYNFAGFSDSDFSGANYTSNGIYLKFRFALDHYTSRKIMAWWEK